MYELVQVGEKSYYIQSPAKIGIYRPSDTEVYLIDSGSDKDAAAARCWRSRAGRAAAFW